MNPTDTWNYSRFAVRYKRTKWRFQSPDLLLQQPKSIQKCTSDIPEYVVSSEQQTSVCFQKVWVQVCWLYAVSVIWTEINALAWLENLWLVSWPNRHYLMLSHCSLYNLVPIKENILFACQACQLQVIQVFCGCWLWIAAQNMAARSMRKRTFTGLCQLNSVKCWTRF